MHGSKPVGCAFAKKLSMAGTNASNFKRTFTFQFIKSSSLFKMDLTFGYQHIYSPLVFSKQKTNTKFK